MDVSDAITTLGTAAAAAGTVGAAVLAVLGVVLGFKVIRRAFS